MIAWQHSTRQRRLPRLSFPLAARVLSLCGLALAGVLAGCGTHGSAGTLPPVAHATLSPQGSRQQAGMVTLTPFAGARVVVYLAGHQIPYEHAANPVELRGNSCTGPVLAALTANAPGPSGSAGQSAPATRPDPAGGADVALTPSASWYVVVLDHAGDANAAAVACGSPLSGRQQYFDLYPPSVGPNGTARGIALLQPRVYTRIVFTLAQPAGQNETWALHEGSCGGPVVASGPLASGATTSQGIAFAAPAGNAWWVSTGSDASSGLGLCGEVR